MSPPFGRTTTTATSLFPLLLIAAVFTAAHGHNITAILERSPDFSTYNEILTKTGVARAINNHRTITVLAVPNDQMGKLAGQPLEVQTRILRAHVILDYFDLMKMRKFHAGQKNQFTNLYQQSGTADGFQGFLDIVRNQDNSVNIFSAVRNAPNDTKVVESVAQFPYNISVLSISQVIYVPGLDGTLMPVAAPPPKTPAAPAPVTEETPEPAESPEDEDVAEDDAPISAPESSEAPSADAPAADGPAGDSPADDNTATTSSPSSAAAVGVPIASALAVALALFIVA